MVAAAGVLAVAWAAAGACRDPAADNFDGAAADGRWAGENRECRYSCERLAAHFGLVAGELGACHIDGSPSDGWPPPASCARPSGWCSSGAYRLISCGAATVPTCFLDGTHKGQVYRSAGECRDTWPTGVDDVNVCPAELVPRHGAALIVQGRSSADGSTRSPLLARIETRNATAVLRHVEMHNLVEPKGRSPKDFRVRYLGGGAVYAHGGSLTVQHAIFRNNSATSSGSSSAGGGAVFGEYNRAVTIEDTLFLNNSAVAGSGGALFVLYSETVAVTRSVFDNNSAHYYGGAAYTDSIVSLAVSGCVFLNSTAGSSSSYQPSTAMRIHMGYGGAEGNVAAISDCRGSGAIERPVHTSSVQTIRLTEGTCELVRSDQMPQSALTSD